MTYQCPRCGYKTDNCYLFKKHLNRQNPCDSTLEDVSLTDLRNQYLSKPYTFECSICHNVYATKAGLTKHKRVCVKKDSEDNVQTDDRIKRLEEEVSKLSKLLSLAVPSVPNVNTNVVNCNIAQTNIQNQNIIIMPLGHENMNHITPEFIAECIRKKEEGLAMLLERKHFDPTHPENHNIKVNEETYEILDNLILSPKRDIIEMKPYNAANWLKMKKMHALHDNIVPRMETDFRTFFRNNCNHNIPNNVIEEFIREIVLPLDWTMDMDIEDDIDNEDPITRKKIIFKKLKDSIDAAFEKYQSMLTNI